VKYLRLLTFAALVSSSSIASENPAPAPSGQYVSDPAHSSVIWKVKHLGLSNYTARFTRMSVELDWNAENPVASKVTASIDPFSVQTNFPFPEKEDFDAEIGRSAPFLGGQPIRFVSTAVKITGDHSGEVVGDLTFRGQTHAATLDVTFNGSMAEQPGSKTPKIGFSAVAKLKRADWGLAPNIKSAGEDVTVIIETELQPKAGDTK
jgi:polyisoprenoid-binding protein YceI